MADVKTADFIEAVVRERILKPRYSKAAIKKLRAEAIERFSEELPILSDHEICDQARAFIEDFEQRHFPKWQPKL